LIGRSLQPFIKVLEPTRHILIPDKILLLQIRTEIKNVLLSSFGAQIKLLIHDNLSKICSVPDTNIVCVEVFDAPIDENLEGIDTLSIKVLSEGLGNNLDLVISRQEVFLLCERTNIFRLRYGET